MILWLDDPRCQDANLTGGKAASLARLIATCHVPPGFCLTTQAYQQMAGAGMISGELQELLTTAYAQLAQRTQIENPRVAVRSSAVGEDGRHASFAGQYETYLNIAGATAVSAAVMQCQAAAQSERVQVYRQQSEEPEAGADALLAVLVQWLVPADISFVAFSANPITGRQDEVMINAAWGLGESIVSGLTAPDTWVVSKTDGQIRQRIIGEKLSMTVLAEEGVKTVTTPRLLREKAALDDKQIQVIAGLAVRLETQMGWPVDIEGAFHHDKLYLLQCRPVSTMKDGGRS